MDEKVYIPLARVEDFTDVPIRSYSIFGKKIGIIKKEDGTFSAIEVSCKHQGADLTKGKIENYIATCHRHQWKYDLLTGECLTHDSPPLRHYPLSVENGVIKVAPIPVSD